jgi:uncharacterized membrane protein
MFTEHVLSILGWKSGLIHFWINSLNHEFFSRRKIISCVHFHSNWVEKLHIQFVVYVRFEVFMVVNMKITVLWDMMPYSVVGGY